MTVTMTVTMTKKRYKYSPYIYFIEPIFFLSDEMEIQRLVLYDIKTVTSSTLDLKAGLSIK